MAVNLEHIAEQLDLSVATVSRSLRNHPRISAETRARVHSMATQMGYKPRMTAPTIPDFLSVGVLVQFDGGSQNPPNWQDLVSYNDVDMTLPMNGMLAGINRAATTHDVSPLIHYVPWEERASIGDSRFQPPALRKREISGLILIHHFPVEAVAQLSASWPCVTLGHHYPNLPIDCVGVDALSSIGGLMEQLLRLGHHRIGFLNHTPEFSWAQMRFSAYVQSLARLNLNYSPELVVNLPGTARVIDQEAKIVVDYLKQGVTAWICSDDILVYRLIEDLPKHGIRIPEDVSVGGFNAVKPPDGVPTATSIRPPFQQMGIAAVRHLLERIEEPDLPSRHILMGCELVAGETIGLMNARL